MKSSQLHQHQIFTTLEPNMPSEEEASKLTMKVLMKRLRDDGVPVPDAFRKKDIVTLYVSHFSEEPEDEPEDLNEPEMRAKKKSLPRFNDGEDDYVVQPNRKAPRPELSCPRRTSILKMFADGRISSEERDDFLGPGWSPPPSITVPQETIYLSAKGLEASNFRKLRLRLTGTFEDPCPSKELIQFLHTIPRGGGRITEDIKRHFDSVRAIYPDYLDLMFEKSHHFFSSIKGRNLPHEAFLTSYRHFLGHAAAMWYFAYLGAEGKTISGVARSLYCSQDELLEDVEKIQKREADDEVTCHKRLLLSQTYKTGATSSKHCKICQDTRPHVAHTHNTQDCGRPKNKGNTHKRPYPEKKQPQHN